MKRIFVRFYSGVVLVFIGIVLVAVSLIQAKYSYWGPFDTTYLVLVIVSLYFATFVLGGGLVLNALEHHAKNIKLAHRWLLLGFPLDMFPLTKTEREMRQPWATERLQEAAREATRCERLREESKKSFATARVYAPPGLAHQTYIYMTDIENANRAFKRYFSMWRMFEKMKMLPIDSATNRPWIGPNEFRLWLKAQDNPA